MIACRAESNALGLPIKIVRAEYSFDGQTLTFLYSTDEEERVETAELRQVMSRLYRARIEMRQISPREVAKILGGMGACGIEERCCSRFLTEFSPISIKHAKEQNLSLNPHDITGMCGRLRCCLVYEYELYVEARRHLPKKNALIGTPMGQGKVVEVLPLRDSVVGSHRRSRSGQGIRVPPRAAGPAGGTEAPAGKSAERHVRQTRGWRVRLRQRQGRRRRAGRGRGRGRSARVRASCPQLRRWPCPPLTREAPRRLRPDRNRRPNTTASAEARSAAKRKEGRHNNPRRVNPRRAPRQRFDRPASAESAPGGPTAARDLTPGSLRRPLRRPLRPRRPGPSQPSGEP